MNSIYFAGIVICIIYLIFKFLQNRFITKNGVNLKELIINTFIVYLSIISGNFVIEQFDIGSEHLINAPVFADGPGF